MPARPLPLVTAAAGLALITGSFALVAVFLLVLAAGVLPFLDSVGGMRGVLALLAAVALGVTGLATASLVGLWRGRDWGWGGSLLIALLAAIGGLVALDSSGAQLPVLIGVGLTMGTLGLLLLPATRRSAGVA